MTEKEIAAQQHLRGEILVIGVEDFVSLADVQGIVDDDGLAASADECQRLMMHTVRSLLEDGLIEVGVIPSPSSPGFKTWQGSVEEVMLRIADRFIERYDDRHEWAYRIWLNLSLAGHQAAQKIAMSGALGALPADVRTVIEEELAGRDPALLAQLHAARKPTTEQGYEVSRLLAAAIAENLGPDWTPNERGLAVERAVTIFFEVWPTDG